MEIVRFSKVSGRRTGRLLTLSAIALIAGFGLSSAWAASAGTSFYKGKTLTVVVPFGPGGGFDRFARLVGHYMQKPLGVAEVKVVNRPGGGGLVGANTIYSSKPDGLTIGDISATGNVFAQFNHQPGMEFNVKKFSWVGRPDNDPLVLFSHSKSSYQTFTALLHPAHPLQALASGVGASEYIAQKAFFKSFDIPFQMVAAFKGSHQMVATFLSGDGDVFAITSHHAPRLKPHVTALMVFSSERSPNLPNVPTLTEEAQKHNVPAEKRATLKALVSILELGRAFVGPPGVPQDRLDALRHAFTEALHNPELLARAKKENLYIGYESAHELEQKVDFAFKERQKLMDLTNAKQ